ncbi:hypothetical protein TNCV_3363341 [Trichonephila clavipes]|nr:hypothetical protein TNCV_3363341 [Trichonephila clavipes]
MVLPQEYRVPDGNESLLREKTTIFVNSSKGRVFKKNNARPHTTVICNVLYKVLPWHARSIDLASIEQVRDIIALQIDHYPQSVLTILV